MTPAFAAAATAAALAASAAAVNAEAEGVIDPCCFGTNPRRGPDPLSPTVAAVVDDDMTEETDPIAGLAEAECEPGPGLDAALAESSLWYWAVSRNVA